VSEKMSALTNVLLVLLFFVAIGSGIKVFAPDLWSQITGYITSSISSIGSI